jgi:CRP/FNR family transcriptional regulator
MVTIEELIAEYPDLAAVPPEQLRTDLSRLSVLAVPARTALFEEHQACPGFPFLLAGQVRVSRGSPDGRSLELYRIGPGEICVVSASCLLGDTPMTAFGQTVQATRLILVDRDTLLRWTDYVPVRRFVMGLMAQRIADLTELVEAVAFGRLDQRLAQALLGRGALIHVTHHQLAEELGTAREMVSRLLKRFEEQGFVQLGREQIRVLDPAALRVTSSGTSAAG